MSQASQTVHADPAEFIISLVTGDEMCFRHRHSENQFGGCATEAQGITTTEETLNPTFSRQDHGLDFLVPGYQKGNPADCGYASQNYIDM